VLFAPEVALEYTRFRNNPIIILKEQYKRAMKECKYTFSIFIPPLIYLNKLLFLKLLKNIFL